jgi:hypothetical protein
MPESPTYAIDGANFGDFAGFVAECNRGFIRSFGGEWSANLDAFNDYLWWGDGRYVLVWRNSAKSRADLGHPAMAAWLEANFRACHPTNRSDVHARLRRARDGDGPTLFDELVGIIRASDHVELRLE